MAGAIHINTMRTILRAGNTCSIKFWKKDGSIVHAQNIIATSDLFQEGTINIKFITSEQFRTIRAVTIFEINDMEVFI
jgi:hypothetical protein